MDTRDMELFLKVADYHSLTKVADEMGMTQPAVSATIKRVEDLVGAPLFVRKGRRLILNQAGLQFYGTAASICVNLSHIKESFALGYSNSHEIIITLRVQSDWLFQQLDLFTSKYENICVTLRPGGPYDKSGLSKISDFSVMLQHDVTNEKYVPIDVQDTLYIIVPVGHPLTDRGNVYLDELRDENFVFARSTSSSGFDASYNACVGAGFTPKISLVTDSAKGKLACIQNGCGIGLVYNNEMNTASKLNDCTLIRVRNVMDRRTICLTWNEETLSEVGETFLKFIHG